MVVFESSISHRIFERYADPKLRLSFDDLTIGLGKAAAIGLFCYFWLKWIGVIHSRAWDLIWTPMGLWFLVEVLGFVLLPCIVFACGVRRSSAPTVRVAAVITVAGIIINRLNVAIVAFRWEYPERYYPHWMEIVVTAALVLGAVVLFRWIVEHMPVLKQHEERPAPAEATG
jgi:hypothetical protein